MIRYRNINIPVFSIPPDWGRSIMRLSEKFGDTIIEALNTAEERHGTQPRGLFSVQFETMTLDERETGTIRKAIEAAGSMPFALPVWPGQCKLTKDAVVGNSFVEFDGEYGDFFDLVPFSILWRDFDKFETFRTFAVGGQRIQFDRPITGDFRAGDMVVPLIVGRFQKDPENALTDTFGEFPVKFEEQFIVDGYAEPFFFGTASFTNSIKPFSYELIGGQLFDQLTKVPAPNFSPPV